MSGDPRRIDALIESIADGSPVDWDALEASAANDSERRVLRHLRLVANVAEVHRTVLSDPAPDDQPIGPSPALMEIGEVGQAIPRWGHLLLLDNIGEGTFGEVYRARDPWLDREVALKLVKPGVSIPAARILHEAQTLARVRHPNVVMVHGADMHDGRVGLWMEFVRGRTVGQLLASQGPFSASEAALIGQELCRALAAVHRAGLVHRDIKSQNVMRESGGRLVLMDFGAGELVEGPQAARPAGTPLYLAPEVLEGGQATVPADIYSLGVLLYHLVTGTFPATGTSIEELRLSHERGELQRLRDVRPELPDTFVAVVEKALDPNPPRRFSSAGDMQHALARVTSPGLSGRMPALPVPAPVPAAAPVLRDWRALLAIAALVIAAAATGLCWRNSTPPAVAPRVSMLAVLPFQNLTGDEKQAYLADGVSLELTSRLGQIGALKVVPWTFMRRFGTGATKLSDVADQTGADTIIEGAVQVPPRTEAGVKPPVQVRIQVFQAQTGALLWSASFERDIGDFFAMQAQIAREVAAKVNVVLSRREHAIVSRQRRVSPEAMEVYLKALQAWETYSRPFAAAVQLYQRAIELEPDFAEAHAGLALSYAMQSAYGGVVETGVALPRALGAANRAIALDDQLPEGYSARAFAKLALAWDWDGAAADFKQALTFNPNSAQVRDRYSNYLTIVGRHEEAIQEALAAAERDPFSPVFSRKVGWAYYHARRYDDAIRQLLKTLEIDSSHVPARTLLARAYSLRGMHAQAIAELEQVRDGNEAYLARAYAAGGRSDDALNALATVLAPSYPHGHWPYQIALAYAALEKTEETLDWLERAHRERDPNLAHLAVDPMVDSVRSEARFIALLDALRLR